MTLFVAEHRHPEDRCPASDPAMAAGLLKIVDPPSARRHGIEIRADAVASGQHHLYLILDAGSEEDVRTYLAPFAKFGTLKVTEASHCEEVVRRGGC